MNISNYALAVAGLAVSQPLQASPDRAIVEQNQVREIVRRAEESAKLARQAARAAEAAAQRAEHDAEAARKAMTSLDGALPEIDRHITVEATNTSAPMHKTANAEDTKPPITSGERSDQKEAAKALSAAADPSDPALCTSERRNIRTLAYTEVSAACERLVLKDEAINRFRAQTTTGVGASVAGGSSGSSASISISLARSYKSLRDDRDGVRDNTEYRLQRVSRLSGSLGVRADFDKEDKQAATIANFGEKDRLTSNFALFGDLNWSFARSERTDLTRNRAIGTAKDLAKECLKAEKSDCEGLNLVRWIFEVDDGGFTNPDAVKAYNEVFWGPPKDKFRRFGAGGYFEVARPKFSYYPFPLTTVTDPFDPGGTKTVIDPASFPANFSTLVTKSEVHYNWTLGSKAFFHLSRERSINSLGYINLQDRPGLLGWNDGTTWIATVAVTRRDEIDEAFRDIEICPAPTTGQAFVTNQTCSKANISRPQRQTGVVLGGEWRQQFRPFWFVPPIMLAPRLTYDVRNDEGGIAIPLLFANDTSGTFNSGLRFGHTWGGTKADGSSKKSETMLGIVLNANLSLDGSSR